MPFRLSERTSNSKALSTICRFVLRRVSFFALRTKLSSVDVGSHGNHYAPFQGLFVHPLFTGNGGVSRRSRIVRETPEIPPMGANLTRAAVKE
jgi:hypothetical protein